MSITAGVLRAIGWVPFPGSRGQSSGGSNVRRPRFVERTTEEISHPKFSRPVSEVSSIQRLALDFEDTQQIPPLAIRNLSALAVPGELGQHGVLSRGKEQI